MTVDVLFEFNLFLIGNVLILPLRRNGYSHASCIKEETNRSELGFKKKFVFQKCS